MEDQRVKTECYHKRSPRKGRRAFGGEFEIRDFRFGGSDRLNLLTHGIPGTWCSSGRGALTLVLEQLKEAGVSHIHLPSYLCESILVAVKRYGMEYSFYPLDASLTAKPDPPSKAAILLIHYFGWLNPAVSGLRAESQKTCHMIEDASQALLSNWEAPLVHDGFTILSPRKFAPTVLGGWCNVVKPIEPFPEHLEYLAWRSLASRLIRGAYLNDLDDNIDTEIERLYLTAFHDLELFLTQYPGAYALPQIISQLIAGVDWEQVARKRRENWLAMHDALNGLTEPVFDLLPESVIPLGYVIRIRNRDKIRMKLAEHRIFCAVHWSLPAEVDRYKFPQAAKLAHLCLTLPIDSRYNPSDMSYIAATLRRFL